MSRVDSLRGGCRSAYGTLGPRVWEREIYLEFIYLSICLSIAGGKNKGGNRDMKKGMRKKGDFVTRDSFERGNGTEIMDAN